MAGYGERRAIEEADVVEAEKSALKDVVALTVLPIHPPREVEEQLVEDAPKEVKVARAVDLEDAQGGPGVHGRVDVAERPLIRRQLPIGMHVPLTT